LDRPEDRIAQQTRTELPALVCVIRREAEGRRARHALWGPPPAALRRLDHDPVRRAVPGGPGPGLHGRRAPWTTYGYSKDRRLDLKQPLFTLTTSADGGIPVQFRCLDGQTNDSQIHIETW
jgi:hypothetical protein